MSNLSDFTPFTEEIAGLQPVRGFLHRPAGLAGDGLVLTHGAGSDCRTPLLLSVAEAFATAGFTVLRCDLPFRQRRMHGPPMGKADFIDRDGLRAAALALRKLVPGRVFLGGHSYGGRQASMLMAEDSLVAAGLLLLAYPLHVPKTLYRFRRGPDGKLIQELRYPENPLRMRTAHFPALRVPTLFVHGTKDRFGTVEELQAALPLIPAATRLLVVENALHELKGVAPEKIVEAFRDLAG